MANKKKEVYKPKPMTEGKRNLIRKRQIFVSASKHGVMTPTILPDIL